MKFLDHRGRPNAADLVITNGLAANYDVMIKSELRFNDIKVGILRYAMQLS